MPNNGAASRQVTLYRLSKDGAMMCTMLPAPPGRLADVQLNADSIAFLADGAQPIPCLSTEHHPLPCCGAVFWAYTWLA